MTSATHTGSIATALTRMTERHTDSFEPLTAALGLQTEVSVIATLLDNECADAGAIATHCFRAHALIAALAAHYGVKSSSLNRAVGARTASDTGTRDGNGLDNGDSLSAVAEIAALTCEYETGRVVPGDRASRSIAEPIGALAAILSQLADSLPASRATRSGDQLTEIFAQYQVPGWCIPPSRFGAAMFADVAARSACPYAGSACLWGSDKIATDESLEAFVHRQKPSLSTFIRAARLERLDAYVLALPTERYGQALEHTTQTLARVLQALNPELFDHDLLTAPIDDDSWRFTIDGEPFFVPVFSPLYEQDHPRYTSKNTSLLFIVLQPDSSFHRHLGPDAKFNRQSIRHRFAAGLQPYQSGKVEADKYLPYPPGHESPPWYAMPTAPQLPT